MSNLIKSVYFNVPQEEKRVIDSDRQVEQFIPQFFKKPEKTEEKDMQMNQIELAADFEEGMNILNMEDVRQQERERVEEELSVEAEKILEDAREEADKILEEARSQAQQISDSAFEEGRQRGMEAAEKEAQAHMQKLKEEFEQRASLRVQEIQKEAKAYEPKFAEIMAQLIEKITGVLCEDKKDTIVYLIHQAMNQLDRTTSVTLRVSKEDMVMVSAHKKELKKCLKEGVEFEILEDSSLSGTQCIIETDNKIIDCSLDVQLQNLKDQIKMLMIL